MGVGDGIEYLPAREVRPGGEDVVDGAASGQLAQNLFDGDARANQRRLALPAFRVGDDAGRDHNVARLQVGALLLLGHVFSARFRVSRDTHEGDRRVMDGRSYSTTPYKDGDQRPAPAVTRGLAVRMAPRFHSN